MANRLIPASNEKAKEIKKMLPLAKNSIESKRIMIMCVYIWGKNVAETKEILNVSSKTVEENIQRYIDDESWFYKTNYKWRQLTNERKVLEFEVTEMIEKAAREKENVDILDVNKSINRKYGMQKLDYHQTRWLVRRVINANYQKPYVKNHKQPEGAKEILNERFTDALLEIWTKTNTIDGQDIKNKKTKNWGIIT